MSLVKVFDAPCGAEITGVDLSKSISEQVVSEIREAWLEHHVLVFRNQRLEAGDLERFTLCFGEFGEDPFFRSIQGHKHIAAIRRAASETTPLFAENWHTDWSFQAKPPIGTCLYSLKIPPVGGDTLFSNQHEAYRNLPSPLRDQVQNLTAIHSASSAYSLDGVYSDKHSENLGRGMDIIVSEDALATQNHPLIRPHTETGELAIYSTAGYIQGFVGLDARESKPLLEALYAHQGSSQFVYVHKWEPEMLVLWDNRSVLHKATGGYDGYERLLYRTTISERL